MMEAVFWACVAGTFYSLAIYPVVLLLLRPLTKSRGSSHTLTTRPSPQLPSVSIIIAAHNEEARIAAKLENLASLDYPQDLLEVVVVSDGSTDATETIVRDHGVRVLVEGGRRGKESAQLYGLGATSGEIVVFSDVATIMEPSVLHALAEAFADETIGAISSVDVLLGDDGRPVGEGAYVLYEMWLRRLEAKVNTLVGLSGSFFAVRRKVCATDWNIHVPSDFACAISCVKQDYRAILVDSVKGLYRSIADPSKEYARKVRTISRGMRGLWSVKEVLNPLRFGMFSFQLISHKLMRWLVPWFMLGALVTNVLLLDRAIVYPLAGLAQLFFYGSAAVGAICPPLLENFLVRNAYYFVQVNLAAAEAVLRFLRRESVLAWTPSER